MRTTACVSEVGFIVNDSVEFFVLVAAKKIVFCSRPQTLIHRLSPFKVEIQRSANAGLLGIRQTPTINAVMYFFIVCTPNH